MIKISVCIPVYKTEQYLVRCLKSVVQAATDFKDYEVLVCNDASSDTVKALCSDFNVICLEHDVNRGLLETRRTLVNNAQGEYILMLDSDDTLMPSIFDDLYKVARHEFADIVHCISNIRFDLSDSPTLRKNRMKSCTDVYFGRLQNKSILQAAFYLENHHCDVWGKLIKRSVYTKALQSIPVVYCNMLENIVQYFFITYYATRYVGISLCSHVYSVNTGMTSAQGQTSKYAKLHLASIHTCFQIIINSKEYASLNTNIKKHINTMYHKQVACWSIKIKTPVL